MTKLTKQFFYSTGCGIFLILGIILNVTAATNITAQNQGSLATWLNALQQEDEPLAPDLAFPWHVVVKDATMLSVSWNISPGYYLYRDKIHLQLRDAPAGIALGTPNLPQGESQEDEFLGSVEVYHQPLLVEVPILRPNGDSARELTLEASFQGCADGRLCYPPLTRIANITLPAIITGSDHNNRPPLVNLASTSESDQVALFLTGGSRITVLLWFFGIGLLLAFTPCVFPMIPILSSIIVGQGRNLTTRHALLLSMIYVLAMALTYTMVGVVAGLVGANLQAIMQAPWIIGTFSAIFVALALSMFGVYELQLPTRLQSYLTVRANHQQGGTLVGVAVMGFLSALIVGPCVAPPLAGALLYISRSGDAILGGLALFAMSMGMGMPLMLIGTTAGHWLPRAGTWMHTVKTIFGVLLLIVAGEMLGRIVPSAVTMLLWASLYIIGGVYLSALDNLPSAASGWQRLGKGVGVILLSQGVLVLTGAASGGDDPWQPLKFWHDHAVSTTSSVARDLWRRINAQDLPPALAAAKGQPVLLDFYADWCVECKRMEKNTFTDPGVRARLAEFMLLRIDVTQNTVADQELMQHYELFGPPALLFFGPDGMEQRAARVVGFMDAAQFQLHLGAAR